MTIIEGNAGDVEGSIDELHDDDHPLFGSDDDDAHVPGSRKRSHRHQQRRRRRRRRLVPFLALVVILALVGGSYTLVHSFSSHFHTKDYTGNGLGFTTVTIAPGDGADDVGAALVKAGVVESTRAFVNAAKASGRSGDIQPGVFRVRLHSSGAAAMAAILNTANRVSSKVTIPEGYIEKQVIAELATKTGLSVASLQAAAGRIANLGLPNGFSVKSAEGFLFPSTYEFNPGASADSVIQQLTAQFGSVYASLNWAAAAKAEHLTPYQVLIIASIAEGEAKFDADRAKVARVLINRLAEPRALQVDATSAYAAKIAGLDPTKIIYATIKSPYNTYTHTGLPPTPIGNPGEKSIEGALHPPAGNWLFYVNIDAAGHLGFFHDEASFDAASRVCAAKGWGCGS